MKPSEKVRGISSASTLLGVVSVSWVAAFSFLSLGDGFSSSIAGTSPGAGNRVTTVLASRAEAMAGSVSGRILAKAVRAADRGEEMLLRAAVWDALGEGRYGEGALELAHLDRVTGERVSSYKISMYKQELGPMRDGAPASSYAAAMNGFLKKAEPEGVSPEAAQLVADFFHELRFRAWNQAPFDDEAVKDITSSAFVAVRLYKQSDGQVRAQLGALLDWIEQVRKRDAKHSFPFHEDWPRGRFEGEEQAFGNFRRALPAPTPGGHPIYDQGYKNYYYGLPHYSLPPVVTPGWVRDDSWYAMARRYAAMERIPFGEALHEWRERPPLPHGAFARGGGGGAAPPAAGKVSSPKRAPARSIDPFVDAVVGTPRWNGYLDWRISGQNGSFTDYARMIGDTSRLDIQVSRGRPRIIRQGG